MIQQRTEFGFKLKKKKVLRLKKKLKSSERFALLNAKEQSRLI